MNSMPAASRVVMMSFKLAGVAFSRPPSDSMRFIVLTLTLDASANAETLHPKLALAIRICVPVGVDKIYLVIYFSSYELLL